MIEVNKRMRIMFVSTNADLAGAPLHVLSLAENLPERLFKLQLIFGENEFVSKKLISQKYDVSVINTLRSDLNIIGTIRSMISLYKIARVKRPHVIHAHSTKAGLVARLVGLLVGIPVIYTIHGWGFGLGRKRILSFFIFQVEYLLKFTTAHYIAVSNADRNIGVNNLRIPENKITTIYNGVENRVINHFPPAFTITMIARNDYQKDYLTFFKAINGIDAIIYCVGRGTDSSEFKKMAKLHAPDSFSKIIFFGPTDNIANILSKTSVFVLSSKFEGLPMTIIEAMAAGIPSVASNVGGISELIIDSKSGYLVPVGGYSLMNLRLRELANNEMLTRKMGAEARRLFERYFSKEDMISSTINVYKFLIKKEC